MMLPFGSLHMQSALFLLCGLGWVSQWGAGSDIKGSYLLVILNFFQLQTCVSSYLLDNCNYRCFQHCVCECTGVNDGLSLCRHLSIFEKYSFLAFFTCFCVHTSALVGWRGFQTLEWSYEQKWATWILVFERILHLVQNRHNFINSLYPNWTENEEGIS